jgi:FlaG/FlaF family flagellin (archaellin)
MRLKLKMSLKNIFIKTFLFLAFGFFLASSAFASKTLYYYKSDSNSVCNLQMSSICTYTASLLNAVDPTHYKYSGCFLDSNSVGLDVTAAQTSTNHSTGVTTTNWIPYGSASAGSRLSKECNDSDVLTLTGCTATCAPDPCMAKKGQTVELEEVCGLSQCPTGATFSTTEQVCKKPNGATVPALSVYSIPAAGQTESFEGCEVVSQSSPDAAGRGYFKPQELGSGELTTYCPVIYKYTGEKGSDSPDTGQNTPSNDANSPSLDDVPKLPPGLYLPKSDGGCDAGDAHGQFGAGDAAIDVCVPGSNSSGDGNGDSGGTCPATGQIKVNGTCQCTTSGYVVKNGVCSAPDSNPDPNPNPDGTTCPNNLPKNPDGSCPSANTTGSGGGSYTASEKCAKAPTCSGDVVQCGLMQESHKAKCDLLEQIGSVPDDVKNAADSLGEAVTDNANINGWAQTTNGYMNILQGLLIPSNSSCNITDIKLQVLAKEINIPLIQFCPFFELVKLLLNITVDLVVIRIVSRAVLSSNV